MGEGPMSETNNALPAIKRKGGLKKIVRGEIKRHARLVLERYYLATNQKQDRRALTKMVKSVAREVWNKRPDREQK